MKCSKCPSFLILPPLSPSSYTASPGGPPITCFFLYPNPKLGPKPCEIAHTRAQLFTVQSHLSSFGSIKFTQKLHTHFQKKISRSLSFLSMIIYDMDHSPSYHNPTLMHCWQPLHLNHSGTKTEEYSRCYFSPFKPP